MAAISTELPVEFFATHRYARISPFKVRKVAALIRHRPVNEALSILRHVPNRGAPMIRKVVASAFANAEQKVTEKNMDVDLNNLIVGQTWVDEGPTIHRWRPRARGSANKIRKRTCHIRVVLRPAFPDSADGGEDTE
jgi:large subunit ribosomal protein L22